MNLLALVEKWPSDRHQDPHTDAWQLGYMRAKRECAAELQAALSAYRLINTDALRGMFRALVDAGGATTVARHGVERGSVEWANKVTNGMLAIEGYLHPERFDDFPVPHPPQAQAGAGDALARIGELIRTQDNRITDQPIFIVQQKRRICGMDEDYAKDFMWYDARAVESYDEAGKAERDADREAEGLPPIEWQRGGYIDIWEFVTACFTEQGCKDYIARDGHNLREPRIYAAGSYRNEEFRAVRKYLAALEASHEPE